MHDECEPYEQWLNGVRDGDDFTEEHSLRGSALKFSAKAAAYFDDVHNFSFAADMECVLEMLKHEDDRLDSQDLSRALDENVLDVCFLGGDAEDGLDVKQYHSNIELPAFGDINARPPLQPISPKPKQSYNILNESLFHELNYDDDASAVSACENRPINVQHERSATTDASDQCVQATSESRLNTVVDSVLKTAHQIVPVADVPSVKGKYFSGETEVRHAKIPAPRETRSLAQMFADAFNVGKKPHNAFAQQIKQNINPVRHHAWKGIEETRMRDQAFDKALQGVQKHQVMKKKR